MGIERGMPGAARDVVDSQGEGPGLTGPWDKISRESSGGEFSFPEEESGRLVSEG